MRLKREGGQFVITTRAGDIIRVYRMRYAFKLAAKLARVRV